METKFFSRNEIQENMASAWKHDHHTLSGDTRPGDGYIQKNSGRLMAQGNQLGTASKVRRKKPPDGRKGHALDGRPKLQGTTQKNFECGWLTHC